MEEVSPHVLVGICAMLTVVSLSVTSITDASDDILGNVGPSLDRILLNASTSAMVFVRRMERSMYLVRW
jgi:hypothetical protein